MKAITCCQGTQHVLTHQKFFMRVSFFFVSFILHSFIFITHILVGLWELAWKSLTEDVLNWHTIVAIVRSYVFTGMIGFITWPPFHTKIVIKVHVAQ